MKKLIFIMAALLLGSSLLMAQETVSKAVYDTLFNPRADLQSRLDSLNIQIEKFQLDAQRWEQKYKDTKKTLDELEKSQKGKETKALIETNKQLLSDLTATQEARDEQKRQNQELGKQLNELKNVIGEYYAQPFDKVYAAASVERLKADINLMNKAGITPLKMLNDILDCMDAEKMLKGVYREADIAKVLPNLRTIASRNPDSKKLKELIHHLEAFANVNSMVMGFLNDENTRWADAGKAAGNDFIEEERRNIMLNEVYRTVNYIGTDSDMGVDLKTVYPYLYQVMMEAVMVRCKNIDTDITSYINKLK